MEPAADLGRGHDAGRSGVKTTLYPGDVNLMAAVVKVWDELSKGHLLGKAIWNIRKKKLLGILDALPTIGTSLHQEWVSSIRFGHDYDR